MSKWASGVLPVAVAVCMAGLSGCGKQGGVSGGGAKGGGGSGEIPVGLVEFELVSAELVERGGSVPHLGGYGGDPVAGPAVPDPLADLRAQGVLRGYDRSIRTGMGPNGGALFPEVTVRLTNHGRAVITEAYVRFAGAVRESTEQIIEFPRVLQPKGVHNYTSQRLVLDWEARDQDSVEAEVVAVVLTDGTVYGDGEVVKREHRAQAQQQDAETMRQVPEAPVTAEWGGVVFDPASVSVVRAVYGAEETWADVTAHFADGALSDGHTCRVDYSHFGLDDPARGVYKTLALTLEVNGREVVITHRDTDYLTLGSPCPGDAVVGASGEPVKFGGVQILAAWYGGESRWLDVLPRVREISDGGGLGVVNCDRLAGSAEGLGKQKQLRVYFEQDGRRLVSVVQETDRRLVLPFFSIQEVTADELPPPRDAPPVPEVDPAWVASGEPEESPTLAALLAREFKVPEVPGVVAPEGPTDLPVIEAVAAELFGPSDIEVVRATFGTPGRNTDVAQALRDKLGTPDGLCGLQTVPSGFGIKDPAPGKIKNLRMTIRIGGKEHQVTLRNRSTLVLGAPGQTEGMVGTTAQPIDVGDTRVLAAWYGVEGGGWHDAMPALRGALHDGRIDASVGRALVGQDPAVGKVKQLRVYYERSGERGLAVYEEDQRMVLPLGE